VGRRTELSDRSRELLELQLASEPDLGSDANRHRCLPGWINTLTRWWDAGEERRLSKQAVGSLLHLLLAQHVRIERLTRERDEAMDRLEGLLGG